MENYRRVRRERKNDDSEPNIIRLGARSFPSRTIRYAIRLLEGESTTSSPVAEGEEGTTTTTAAVEPQKYDTVVLMGMGAAITNVVSVAEILKRRVKGLHQITKVEVSKMVDEFEPLEQGLDRVTIERRVPGIVITLSLNELDTKDPGYQAPIPEDQVMSQEEYENQMRTRQRQRRSPQRKEQKNAAEEGGEQQRDEEEGAEKPRRRARRGGNTRRRGGRARKTNNASTDDSSTNAAPAAAVADEKPPVSSEQ